MSEDVDKLRQERDLYLALLRLGTAEQLDAFLHDALHQVSELAGATQGYLELRGQRELEEESWHCHFGFSDAELDAVTERISSGIIAEALATGETVMTPAAFLDPRFSTRQSVELGKIGAVLCSPVGMDARLGVLYLHSGADRGSFSETDRDRVELFARHLAPFADRLITRKAQDDALDPTSDIRSQIAADRMVGRSDALAGVLRQIALVAPLDVNVLLTGPTGCGKTLVAQVIHDSGPRAEGPFVELNCATLSADLLESELFGAKKGSHSTATQDTPGKVAAAEGGTLFLDEIAELPPASQAKLLQLLQTKQYFTLGSNKPVTANIRLISATNAALEQAVSEGRFREDLFYRLQVLPIAIPGLNDRRDDIPDLCEGLGARICQTHGFNMLPISAAARAAARMADWPGNIRQLENSLEGAIIRAHAEGAGEVERGHLFPNAINSAGDSQSELGWTDATRNFQRDFLLETLRGADWNITQVARQLGLARSHVYTLISSLEIKRGEGERATPRSETG